MNRQAFRPRSVAGSGRSYDSPRSSRREIGCFWLLVLFFALSVLNRLGWMPWPVPVALAVATIAWVLYKSLKRERSDWSGKL